MLIKRSDNIGKRFIGFCEVYKSGRGVTPSTDQARHGRISVRSLDPQHWR